MRQDDRYDIWSCARCGRVEHIPSLPRRFPNCCGTMMWFVKIEVGEAYEWDDAAVMKLGR